MIMMGDKKKIAYAIIGKKGDGEKKMAEGGEVEETSSLNVLADELISALESKDTEGVVSALKAFFYECDAMPHEEGEHTD